ncbi:MAG TPA: stage II sporulation protein M [Terriglobales bacterium]|nr:stage II sporulation protein M [Terriglobales bacterium]
MISTRWMEKRRPLWTRLENLVDRVSRGGISALNHAELQELSLLYRQTAADLATVREDASGRASAEYLNRLLGRAHNIVYSGSKRGGGRNVLQFYWEEYPRIFRETFSYSFAAFTVFVVSAVAGMLVAMKDPGFVLHVIGPRMVETIDRHEMWTHSIVAIKPVAASEIMTNNLSVSFMTFAMGITAGAGTLLMLAFNGLLIGVIGTACWQANMSLGLWSFVAPHGVLELPAIFIAGGAGLMLGRGMLFPGILPRMQSLVLAGNKAVKLVLGIIPLLIVAGTIEGFFSPSSLPVGLKFIFAACMFALLVAYLSGGFLGKQRTATD